MTLSTDLGSIAAVAPAEQQQAPDVLGGMKGIGTAIGDAIVSHRLSKHDEALAKDAENATKDSGEVLEIKVAATGDPAADLALNEIYALQDGVAQNTGSNKELLALQLRQRTQEFADKYPNMRNQFAAQLGTFIRVNPEVAALDAFDKSGKAAAALAAKELEDIKTYAYDDLGMSPIGFGTERWAAEFARREGHVQAARSNEQILKAQESAQDLTIDDHLATFQRGMAGDASDAVAIADYISRDLDSVALALQDITAPGAHEVLSAWNNGGKAAAMQIANNLLFRAKSRLLSIPSYYVDNPKYASAKALHDQQTSAISMLISGIESDAPHLIEAYQAYNTSQLIGYEQTNPVFAHQMRMLTHYSDALVAADGAFDLSGEFLGNVVAGAMNLGFSSLFGRDVGLVYNNKVRDHATVEELRNHAQELNRQNPDMYGLGTRAPKDNRTATVVDDVLKMDDQYLNIATTPDVAAMFMESKGARYEDALTNGTFETDGLQKLLEGWRNPNIVEKAKLATQSNQPASVQFVTEGVTMLANQYEPTRVQAYKDILGASITSTQSLASENVLTVDTRDIKNGNIKFIVDADTIYPSTIPGLTPVTASRESAIAVANENAAELSRRVSRDLKWKAHIQAVYNETFTPDYETEWLNSFQSVGAVEDAEE